MKKQKLYQFTVGTGMSIENSTPEERKEIYILLMNKGYETYSKDIDDIESNLNIAKNGLRFNGREFLTCANEWVTNPLTYSEMKALITGERTKLTHAQAVEKLKGGAQLKCSPFDQIKVMDLFNFVPYLKICWPFERNEYYAILQGNEVFLRQNPIQGVEIIELGDIEEETDNKIKSVVSEEMFNDLDKMIKKLKKASKLSKQLAKDSKRLFSDQTMRMDEEMKLSVDFAKTEVKELEKGKWYKVPDFYPEKFMFYFGGEYGNEKTYGFDIKGLWANNIGVHKEDEHVLLTPEEVETALTNYAKSIGLVEGAYAVLGKVKKTTQLKGTKYWYDETDNSLNLEHSDGFSYVIFSNGAFSEVLKTRTRKEVEEELNIKIVD